VNPVAIPRRLASLALCAATVTGCANVGRGPIRLTAAGSASARVVSQCMRAHGVANFPQPTDGPGGAALTVDRPPDGSAITVNGIAFSGPTFDSAVQACGLFAGRA
jgi:hypothetical protein